MSGSSGVVAVFDREVIALHDIVVDLMSWLTMGDIDDKELRRYLRYRGALLYERWNHLIGLGCPDDQLFTVVRVTENVSVY